MKHTANNSEQMIEQIVIVGAVSLGPKVAIRVKRLKPHWRIILIDKNELHSYAACGIPYYISGDITEEYGLRETNFKVRRDRDYYRNIKQIDMRAYTKALYIDRHRRVLRTQDLKSGEETDVPYDKLILATGKRAAGVSVPGEKLANIYSVYELHNAIKIREAILAETERAVIIGGGFSGIEMCEALRAMWGIDTTLIEMKDQILSGYVEMNIARMIEHNLRSQGVDIGLGETVLRFEGKGNVERVITDKRIIETDMVILANGIVANFELARDAGLSVSRQGRIIVNQFMQTSDPNIFAGGDCVEIPNLITGKPDWFPLNSMAQRQGRIIGTNVAGGKAAFKGAVGNHVVKVFDQSLACAGLNVDRARKEGFDAIGVTVAQLDHAHFWVEKNIMFIMIVLDRATGRVLGIQALGGKGEAASSRVNAVAVILENAPTVEEIANLEISYSPPFAAAMDILNAAGNVAENVLIGRDRSWSKEEFQNLCETIVSGKWLIIDTRTAAEAGAFVECHQDCWVNIPLAEFYSRIDEIPKDRKLLIVCKTGLRSYECHSILKHFGFNEHYNLYGGIVQLEMSGIHLDQ